MKKRMKPLSKRSVSLALAACFNFVPSLDAGEMEVYNVVNSISGLLGGSYQLSNAGTYNGPSSVQSWGSGTPAGIMSSQGLLAGSGIGVGLTGSANIYGNTTASSIDNPLPGGVNGSGVQQNNYNLYGQYGLLSGYDWKGGTFYNIYNFPSLGQLLGTARSEATLGYQNRLAFSGLANGVNNILNPGTAVTNNPYIISWGSPNHVLGNLSASQVSNPSNLSTANALMGTIYKNMQDIWANVNQTQPSSNQNAYWDTAFSSIQGAGAALIAALNGTAGSSASFSQQNLTALSNLLGGGANSLVTGTAGNYTFSSGGLNKLEAYNAINNLVAGGQMATSSGFTSQFKTINTALGNDTIKGNLATIANDTLNTSNPDAVVTALQNMNIPSGKAASLTQVATALQGLVNPNAYAAVYQAYVNLTTGGSVSFSPAGVGSFTAAATPSDTLASLQTATGTSSAGQALQNVLLIQQYLNTTGAITNSDTAAAALVAAAFDGGSSSAYQALVGLLKNAGLTASASTDYTSQTGLVSSNVSTGGSVIGTSAYPYNKNGASDTTNGGETTTSWLTTAATNQKAYIKQLTTNIANVLTPALNYSSNVSKLTGLLSSSMTASDITAMLNNGINNVTSDSLGSGTSAANQDAQALNNIKAIFYSEDLLGTYVGAITAPQSGTTAQQAQASALTYLNDALSASANQNGLIAQTRAAIQGQLNTSFNLTSLSSTQGSNGATNGINHFALSGLSSASFNPAATPTQIAQGIGAIYAINQLVGGNGGYDAGSLNTSLDSLNTLASNINAVTTLADAGITLASSLTGNALTEAQKYGLSAGETINSGNVANFIMAVSALGSGVTANTSKGNGLLSDNWSTTNVASTSMSPSAAIAVLVGNAANAAGSAVTLSSVTGAIATATGAAALQKAIAIAPLVAESTAGESFTSAAISDINNILLSGQKITADTSGGKNAVSALGSGSPLDSLLANSGQLEKDLGLLGPSIAQQFANGSLSASQLSSILQAVRADYTAYYNLDSNSVGGASSGTPGTNGTSISLGNTASTSLQSLLSSSLSAPQDLGFANAAVNSIATELKGLSGILSSTYQATFGAGAADSSTASTSPSALNALATLQTAVGNLWKADNTFFGTSTANNLSTITTLGNLNGNQGGTSYSGVAGIPVNSLSSGNQTNATAYLQNLQNFSTLTNLLGNVVESNGSTSGNYQAAFTVSQGAQMSLVTNIASQGQILVNALKPGVQLSALVQALQNITSSNPSAHNYQAVTNAIKEITTSTAQANPSGIWTAFHSLAQSATLKGGTETPVQALYGIISGATSGVTGDANSKTTTNPGSPSSGFNAAGVAQMIEDGIALQKANNALAGPGVGSISQNANGLLATTAGAGNAAAYLAAQTAANSLGQLLNYLNPTDQTASNVYTFITALDSYNHNMQLLNSLTGSSTKTQEILNAVVGYATANKTANTYSGSDVSMSGLNSLQTLVNRLQYLESLQGQIQTAINNNPYALLMEKDQLQNSAAYQGALKSLLTNGTANPNGLFNQVTSTNISNALSGSGASGALSLNNGAAATISGVNTDLTNLSNWNSLINGLNSQTGVFIPGISYGNGIAHQMGRALGAINTLITTFSPGQDSSDTASLTASFGNLMSAYQDITKQNGSNQTLFAQTGLTSGSSFDAGATGMPTSAAGIASSITSNSVSASSLQLMQDVLFLQNNLANGTANSGTPASYTANGIFSTSISGGTATATLNTNLTTLDTNIGTLNTEIGKVTTALAATTNAIAGSGAYSSLQIANASIAGVDKVSNSQAPLLIEGLISAMESNATLKGYLDGSTTIAGAGAAIITALKADSALNAVVGSGFFNNAGFTATKAANLMTALKQIALAGATPATTPLGAINALLNTSSASYTAAPTAGANVLYSSAELQAMLSAAHQLANAYNTTNTMLGNGTTSGLSSWVGLNSNKDVYGFVQAMQKVMAGIDQVAAPFQVDSAGIQTTSTSSTAPAIDAAQALMAYVSDSQAGANGLSANAAALPGGLLNDGNTNTVLTAASAASLASLTPTQQFTDLVAAQLVSAAGGFSALSTATGTALTSSSNVSTIISAVTSAMASNPSLATQYSNAVDSVVKNFSTYATDWSQTSIASAMQGLSSAALSTALGSAAKYVAAIEPLLPLLNTAENTSSSSPASATNILSSAISSSLSLQNLLRQLNGSAMLQTGGSGVAVSSLSSNDSLSPSVIAAIKALLGKLEVQQGKLSGIQSAIAANPMAQKLEGLIGQSGTVTQLNNALSQVESQNMSVGTYTSMSNSYINTASQLLATEGYNVTTLLYNLKSQLDNVSQYAQSLQNVSQTLDTLYNEIRSAGLNFSTGQTAINNAISALTTVQQELLNSLAGASGGTGNSGQSGGGGAQLMAVLAKDGVQPSVLIGDISQMTPSQKIAALKAIQNALVFANAAKEKYASNGASYIGTGLAKSQMTAAANTNKMNFTNSNGNMYGIDVQFGYKQFFGKRKRWGLRYYASFSYQHGTFMDSNAGELDNFVYGAGVDALYNFYESKDAKYTTGFFAGLMLAGSSWGVKGQSQYQAMMNAFKTAGGTAQMNTSYFQIPINLGFRTNVNKHNGFEVGLRIPLAVNYYFKGDLNGLREEVSYKRNVSVFFNYVYNF
ncbi:outer membrane protein [Helicobacter ailurogastricus]|uniref:Uncharacterized protein n=1 Tax=Helicobacter ailurogastricus TaxID=1578720 RepID=A0A0K2XCR1_9HELI|nr:outer membrane protein [Helicobacter ailurogastricus]CRF43338.1 hypothetical protein HAL013_15700 [Helicobacter ailurogastricus]